MNELVKVDFYGDTILTQQVDEKTVQVVIKPIVERIGIDWRGQLQRIKRDPILSVSVCMIHTETPAGPREALALPLNLIPGFLFGIDSSRIVDPNARELVLTYQRECHEVLFLHFFGVKEAIDPTANWNWELIREKIGAVREMRLSRGKKAAAALWDELGLPNPLADKNPIQQPTQGIEFVQQFLDDCTEEHVGGRVQASVIYEAFCKWVERTKAPAMTQTAFGRTLGVLDVSRSSDGRVRYYVGLRIRHESEMQG